MKVSGCLCHAVRALFPNRAELFCCIRAGQRRKQLLRRERWRRRRWWRRRQRIRCELGTRREKKEAGEEGMEGRKEGKDMRRKKWGRVEESWSLEPRLQQQSILGDKQDFCGMKPVWEAPNSCKRRGKSDRQQALYPSGEGYTVSIIVVMLEL